MEIKNSALEAIKVLYEELTEGDKSHYTDIELVIDEIGDIISSFDTKKVEENGGNNGTFQ